MKYYKVIDNQQCGFMSWTHETPQTKQQIRSYLYQMANDQKTNQDDLWAWNDYKLDEALADFDLELEEVIDND